jgi:hypothetical protein
MSIPPGALALSPLRPLPQLVQFSTFVRPHISRYLLVIMTGELPWPEVPIGNKNHANAAVVIIGGGISGMCLAIDLLKRNKCRNFIILEKSASLGGTW